MPAAPRLLSLATAVPPFRIDQAEVTVRIRRLFPDIPDLIERLISVYGNSGIETRYSCVPAEWYETSPGWAEKNRLYLENAVVLIERAARECLAKAGRRPQEVDAIVVVSTTGIATPSLDALLMDRMEELRRDVRRLPIFGLGCAGGVLGLARAAAQAKAEPDSLVLLLVVELCGLTFRRADQSKGNIVATALFGDGAAGALLSCQPGASGPAVAAWGEHTWRHALDVMGWRVRDDGLGVLFSRDIPSLIRSDFRAVADVFLERQDMTVGDVANWICHPGGAKVVSALEDSLDLPPDSLSDARAVLRDYGNMSAATVLFVLDRALRRGLTGRSVATALGPGFTAGFALLESP